MWHGVPRLDNPSKLWLLPAPVAKWLGLGIVVGPLWSAFSDWWTGAVQGDAWNHPLAWIVWGVGLLLGLLGAFFRPGGHDLGRWLVVLAEFVTTPKRAVWRA